MSRIKDLLLDERPRERLWTQGAAGLKTSELLAILLRVGMKGKSAVAIGDELLERYQGLEALARAPAVELARVKGVGMAKAVQLKAAFELGVRLARSQALLQPVATALDVQNLLGEEMRQLPHESLRVLALNTRCRLIAMQEISRGTINETVAHPREILRVGLLHQAFSMILVHNHPSGDPTPSAADLDFTRNLREACKLMQIDLLDHVILGTPTAQQKGYYSFKESGYL
ncbi:MAG: DNA repair protein RadC [Blastochloris sp.]|nr:DNA repair protein RadC [Blastochloris sp.]